MRDFIWKLLKTSFFPILALSALSAQRVKALALLVNFVKALVIPNVKRQQKLKLCHKGEKVSAFSIVGKNIQKNPWPGSLKGAQESVDILCAIECPPKYESRMI